MRSVRLSKLRFVIEHHENDYTFATDSLSLIVAETEPMLLPLRYFLIVFTLLGIVACNRGNSGGSSEPGRYMQEVTGEFGGYMNASIDDWPIKAGQRTHIIANADIFRRDADNTGQDIVSDLGKIYYRITASGGQPSEWRKMIWQGEDWDHVETYETFKSGAYVLDFKFGSSAGREFNLTGWKVEVK